MSYLPTLISNGIKYNQQAEKVIEIGYLDPDDAGRQGENVRIS